jgi:hypothetical protein
MHPLQPLIGTCRWAGQNFAHNLKFVPEDKAHWKPAPEAPSALTVTAHVIFALQQGKAALTGETIEHVPFEEVAAKLTLEEAQQKIVEVSETYAQFMESLTPADLEGDIELPFGTFPKMRFVGFPVIDLLHHHGQLAYLQMIWGDTVSHFQEMDS